MDLIGLHTKEHGKRVAFIALHIANEYLDIFNKHATILASLSTIGSFGLYEKPKAASFKNFDGKVYAFHLNADWLSFKNYGCC